MTDETILPKVKGSPSVVAKSHARFRSPHICRHCKQEFFPKQPKRIFLCDDCYAIPEPIRRKMVCARSAMKRKGHVVKHRDGSVLEVPPVASGLDVAKGICDSPLGGCDRSTVSGAMRYWKQRPWHFTDIWKIPATDKNIMAIVKNNTTTEHRREMTMRRLSYLRMLDGQGKLGRFK